MLPVHKETPTVTLPKPMCAQGKDDGMTYEMQMTAVNMANYYRRLLGTGWAKDKGGYAPTAKMLYALGYECNTLGSGAKAKIDNCQAPPYTADQSRTLTYYKVDDVNIDPKTVIEQAFKTWADQAKKVDIQAIAESVFYEGDVATEASDWAKLTTAKNSFLGCSLKKCDAQGFTVFVCQYNGLFTNGDPIYTVGKPCAGCAKAGRKCDNALGGGLCIK
ncbi:SCP-like protein [Ancylostoma caninum]|uniref:SCP-like protein n=1 Tax=Ancylostoma caninum TaxID=29170 RepID=A0A368GSA7_ANCCA|nr:SCP-like protein [Ancylostoma caninum]